jgi:uncharacterized protein YraI
MACFAAESNMLRNIFKIAVVGVAGLSGGAAAALAAGCVVADPTGTPLNVRSEPQGRVLSVLDNGVTVDVLGERTLGGKRWAKVAANGETRGWVFAAYLKCTVADDSKKSAPMKPRIPPQ